MGNLDQFGIHPGMYVYADGKISSEIIPGCQIKAVVGYIEDGMAYAVCLRIKADLWINCDAFVEEPQIITNGKEATRKILEFAKKHGRTAYAAQKCYDYAEDGVQQGEAFLPSLCEFEKLYVNKEAIITSLKALHADVFSDWSSYCCYWTSTEKSYDHAMAFWMDDGHSSCIAKLNLEFVRPFIAVKI